MVSADIILSKLSPYRNESYTLEPSQTVGDIKKGIYVWHKKYQGEYDQIYQYFKGATAEQSARNVYDFLRNNVDYIIEDVNLQYLRSPAAILAPGHTLGADCKNYSLFTAGVLDAISRNTTQRIPLAFRFASYDLFSEIPKHVFVVVNPGTANEIWVDPVLPYFNDKKQPTYYTDKKIKSMALVALAGTQTAPIAPIDLYKGLIAERNALVSNGRMAVNSKGYLIYTDTINRIGDKLGKARIGDTTTSTTGTLVNAAASFIPYGTVVTGVLNAIFAKGAPNPNNWKDWPGMDAAAGLPLGTNAQSWVLQDGDSPKNEALNIAQWIQNYGITSLLTPNENMKARFGRYTTLQDIVNKLSKGGYQSEAQALLQNSTTSATGVTTVNSSMNMWVTLAIVGGGLLLLLKK